MATVDTTTRVPADSTTTDRTAGHGRQRMPRAAWYTICVLVAAMMLFPLVMLVLASVKTPAEAAASPPTYLPSKISFQNVADLSANSGGLLRHVLNSVLVALGTVLGVVVLSTLGGYGFARYEFPRRNVLFIVILSTLMIPFQAILTPLFLVLARVNLTNSLIGLTLVYITFQLPFALFLMHHHLPAAAALLREGDGRRRGQVATRERKLRLP